MAPRSFAKGSIWDSDPDSVYYFKTDIDAIKERLKHDELSISARTDGGVWVLLHHLHDAVAGSAEHASTSRAQRKFEGIRDDVHILIIEIEKGEVPRTHRDRADPRRHPDRRTQLARQLGEIEVRLRELEKDGTIGEVERIVWDKVQALGQKEENHYVMLNMIP